MPDTRYDADFYAWTQEQAALLRRMAEERVNTRLDLEHLAEEVEGLGNNELAVVDGSLRQLIIHLLKLEWSPDPYPRRHWEEEAGNFRDTALERLERAPGVRRHIDLGTARSTAARRKRRAGTSPGCRSRWTCRRSAPTRSTSCSTRTSSRPTATACPEPPGRTRIAPRHAIR